MATEKVAMKQYPLSLPQELWDELQDVANTKGTSVKALLQQFIKLGLLAVKLEETPDAALIIREGSRERQIMML